MDLITIGLILSLLKFFNFFSFIFLQTATNTCKSLGISDSDLQSCIYDVAITNDTTFTDQEGFKRGMLTLIY